MKVDRKRAEQSLVEKGFRRDKSPGHVYFFHIHRGQETGIKTYVSHSKKYKDIGPDNLESMRRQLRLETRGQAIDLLQCPMSGADYNDYLIEMGHIDPEDPS